jgi:radial spoke head protein 4A
VSTPVAADGGEEAEAAQAGPVCHIPDIISDNKAVYQWAGINLGDYNAMMLQKSLQKLAQTSGASKLRFWGQILGTERDYFVAEGVAEAPATEEEVPADKEARGTGVNEFAYWVCNSPCEGKWTALPDLLPSDVEIARQVKFRFTGDLDRRVFTNPFFHKRENFLLRAQIARISIGTALVPKGIFKLNEEDPTAIEENLPDEGPVPMPSVQEMCKPQMWVHHMKSILKCNRTTLMEVEAPEGVEPEDFAKMRAAQDPSEARLKDITCDDRVKGNAAAWIIRAHGDMTAYQASNPSAAKQVFGCVVVRSNTWPGALSFFTQQRQHMSVYVGDGLKFEHKTYYPVHTPVMQCDPEERLTYAEPNPTEAAIKRKAEQEARDAAGVQDE